MRTLKELGALVADDAAERYFIKRANLLEPMAFGMGLQLPGIASDAHKRYLDTKRQLALAATTNIGERIASEKKAERKTVSGREMKGPGTRSASGTSPAEHRDVPEGWNMSSPHAHDPEGMVGHFFDMAEQRNKYSPPSPSQGSPASKGSSRFVTLGPLNATSMIENVLSKAITGGMGSLYDTARDAWKSRNFGPARDAIIADLKKNDPIITRASEETIADAMASMIRFAPVLSTDKNAVRSYLREAVMSGAGPNYSTIKSLADAEHTVTGKGKD